MATAMGIVAASDVSDSARSPVAVTALSFKQLALEYETNLNNCGGGEVMESQTASGDQGSGAGNVEVVPSGDQQQQHHIDLPELGKEPHAHM